MRGFELEPGGESVFPSTCPASTLRYFLGDPRDPQLLIELGHSGGGVFSAGLEARWLASLAEYRVG